MSAQIRKQIEAILRGDTNFDLDKDDDNEVGEEQPVNEDDEMDEVQAYVLQSLHHEGFTRRQAKTAFQEHTRNLNRTGADIPEEEWDSIYESCLQWLLIHLDEDQLPEGYSDAQGKLFDVIAAPTTSNAEDIKFASIYGITPRDASLVRKQADATKRNMRDAFWDMLVSQADALLRDQNDNINVNNLDSRGTNNEELFEEEVEALESIFASDFKISDAEDGYTLVQIKISEDGSHDLDIEVLVKDGSYPSERPGRVLVHGQWPSDEIGAALHLEVIKFLATQELGEAMIFGIHGHVVSLLQSPEDLARVALRLPKLISKESDNQKQSTGGQASKKESKQVTRRVVKRPRDRSYFWSTPPKDTPPAVAFPKIPFSLEKTRKSLPAAAARAEFLSVLRTAETGGRVLLVTGDTGCGKTTQIPQFILEESPTKAKIVVAQPRRLAATGVAARVANERGELQVGSGSVGYVVRGDTAMSKDCRLLFCTTGVLLRQMQNNRALESISHIVVDEVHERNLDTDILLGLLRQGVAYNPHLCVVLMSATLDADKFANYWGRSTPRMHIPGRTFPVVDYFLEDVLKLTNYIPPKRKGNPGRASDFSRENSFDDSGNGDTPDEPELSVDGIPITDLISRIDEASIDYNLLARLVKCLVTNKTAVDDGSILVFLPGAPEINMAMETIKRVTRDLPIFLLPLHGGLQPREQNAVFSSPPKGITKVVLATNICETSVTIPDCTIVIDTARVKESSYDPANRMPLLIEQFASKASLKQRRGRAGRVRDGTCYKLISQATFNKKLSDHGSPEISRCALDQTLLSLLFLGVETGAGIFMNTLLDPPSKQSLKAAAYSLRQIGAVQPGIEGSLTLTPLGIHLAGIPAPPTIGKLLIMGSILGVRTAALAMAAGLSLGRSPFLRIDDPRKRRGTKDMDSSEAMKAERVIDERAKLAKLVGNSDHALLAAIFSKWEGIQNGDGTRRQLCESLGLSFNGMKDMHQLVRQLDSSLNAIGYDSKDDSDRNANSWSITRACAVAAMAPSQVVKIVKPAATYQQTAEGALEVDGDAKGLQFFIRSEESSNIGNDKAEKVKDERVFIHPSSFHFATGNYSCPWLVYHSLVRTSKPFLRDVTECSSYALLLFGGDLMVKAGSSDASVVIDGWITLSSSPRIVSLVGSLRQKVDNLLLKKIDDPHFQIAKSKEMQMIVKLIKTNGEGI